MTSNEAAETGDLPRFLLSAGLSFRAKVIYTGFTITAGEISRIAYGP